MSHGSKIGVWMGSVAVVSCLYVSGYFLLPFVTPSKGSKTDDIHLSTSLDSHAGAESHDQGKGHAAAPDSHDAAPHWEYEGASGPAHWGDLAADFSLCKTGHTQSPVNITPAGSAHGSLMPKFSYHPTQLVLKNNGHTLQADAGHDNFIELGHDRYDLLQFHFHTPSEHLDNGRRHNMEVHFVHKHEKHGLAVVGIFIKEGKHNPLFGKIWEDLPGKEGALGHEATLDLAQVLPHHKQIVSYAGSLTTPPCSEGVKWMVFNEPIEFDAAQIKQFTSLFPINARPVQPMHDRKFLVNSEKQLAH